ncbi:MAG: class I SAM-dependent methyltransferase [Planctomycetes bacterium]|nr:class I SAM-dependent methyltransferase [Planctomycetota bacterium]
MRESLVRHLAPPTGEADPHAPALKLAVFSREGEHVVEGVLYDRSGRWWWIAGGIPRLLPAGLYRNRTMEQQHHGALERLGLDPAGAGARAGPGSRLDHQTMDRFGDEWRVFRDWGYHDQAPEGREAEFQGGLWANTLSAFASKTFLCGRVGGKLCLDAGCGNGRFTAAALAGGAGEVIAMDIGWGVEAAFEHHRDDPRVHVVQASLFDLPIRRVDVAFSIGVLMHTGDAQRAFMRVASVVGPGGLLAVRMYHRGNIAYELTDRALRMATTRLSRRRQMRLAERMAGFGRWLCERDAAAPGTRVRWYSVVRNWPTVHHNLDWWGAPVATHHTVPEVLRWAHAAGLGVVKTDPAHGRERYGFWEWPEALTALFERAPVWAAGASTIDAKPIADPTGAAVHPVEAGP